MILNKTDIQVHCYYPAIALSSGYNNGIGGYLDVVLR